MYKVSVRNKIIHKYTSTELLSASSGFIKTYGPTRNKWTHQWSFNILEVKGSKREGKNKIAEVLPVMLQFISIKSLQRSLAVAILTYLQPTQSAQLDEHALF